MTKVSIVRITDDNIPAVVKLYNQDYKLLTSSQIKLTIPRFKKWMKHEQYDHYCLKAGKKIVGLMFTQQKKDFWIKAILIDKHWRGKGFGSLLIKKAKQLAKKLNKKLKAEVIEGNKASLELFTNNGFKITKEIKQDTTNEFILEHKKR